MKRFGFDEKHEYQKFIIEYLVEENGYIKRSSKDFNPIYAMDQECLFDFLYTTQQEKMENLEKIYKNNLRDILINFINTKITNKENSLINVLKHGVEIDNIHLYLMYTKPATSFN